MFKALLIAALLTSVPTSNPTLYQLPVAAAKAAKKNPERDELRKKLEQLAKEVGQAKGKKVTIEALLFEENGAAFVVFNEGDGTQVGMMFLFQDGEWYAAGGLFLK